MNHIQCMNSEPREVDVSFLIEELVMNERIMTLATAYKDVAWAAPVMYLYLEPLFYFFSSSHSRHIQEALRSGHAAATIFTAAASWQEVRGLQMFGGIRAVPGGLTKTRVTTLYQERFTYPEMRAAGRSRHASGGRNGALGGLYQFFPSLLVYMDNRIRLGFSEARIVTRLAGVGDDKEER